MPLRVYEAIVVNAAPDNAPAGHISVYIPEIAGTDELPVTVAPLFSGWTAGGWHSSVPQAVLPETEPDSGSDNDKVRVTILAVTEYDLRWIGTSQYWSEITNNASTRCGVRSPKGHHKIVLDDVIGAHIVVSNNANLTGDKNSIVVGTDNIIKITTANDTFIKLDSGVVTLSSGALASVEKAPMAEASYAKLALALTQAAAACAALGLPFNHLTGWVTAEALGSYHSNTVKWS